MQKNLFPLVVIALILSACADKTVQDPKTAEIENSLIPYILFEGRDTTTYTLEERMRHYRIPGVSMAFMDRGEIVWTSTYGHFSFDSLHPVDAETMFQAASISKPVAAMAALGMVEEDLLSLDENVNNYLQGWQVEENEFTKEEKVTLRRLLSHSAGLTVHGFGGYAAGDPVPTTVQVLKGEEPANSPAVVPDMVPGTQHRYSGGGFTVMQKMLTDICGKPFPGILEERVLTPLEMTRSTYVQPLPEEYHENAARAHGVNGNMIEGRWHTYPEMAAAGLWTTPSDLLKYARELQQAKNGQNSKVLQQSTVEEMLTPQAGSYGLGIAVSRDDEQKNFGHGGANAGYRCRLFAYADGSQAVAIMTNSDNGHEIIGEILRGVAKVYSWPNFQPNIRILHEMTKEQLRPYAGTYVMEYQGRTMTLLLSVEEDHLTAYQQWDEVQFLLYPESTSAFVNPSDGTPVVFSLTSDGEVTGLLVSNRFSFSKMKE